MSWNPELYHKFQEERFAPFEDLLSMVDKRSGIDVVDLGCGTGELTLKLREALPDSRILGIDSSPEMLEKAGRRTVEGIVFENRPIERITGRWDLIFSNAALQWLDDHAQLVPKLFSMLNAGGQLVVQVPSNHNHISQTLLADTASEEPFLSALSGWSRKTSVLTIGEYAQILYSCNASRINVLEKVYPHVLQDADSIVQWLAGTALLAYIGKLPDYMRESFVDEFRKKLARVYPDKPVFYPFRRILFSAVRDS